MAATRVRVKRGNCESRCSAVTLNAFRCWIQVIPFVGGGSDSECYQLNGVSSVTVRCVSLFLSYCNRMIWSAGHGRRTHWYVHWISNMGHHEGRPWIYGDPTRIWRLRQWVQPYAVWETYLQSELRHGPRWCNWVVRCIGCTKWVDID